MQEILDIKKRFSRKSKNRFLEVVKRKLTDLDYEHEEKKFGTILTSINLETKNDDPDYIFIAHYDTGTVMPFWMNWFMRLVGINRQLLMLIMIIVLMELIKYVEVIHPIVGGVLSAMFFLPLLLIALPNSKNYDDNTSGVISLIKLAKKFKEQGINNVKFLFVDNEELGLFGSSAHRKYLVNHKLISDNCKVISIDCVGGSGDIPLIISNGKSNYLETFREAIKTEFDLCKTVNMLFPASDNYSFRKFGAINISFVSETIIPNGYYINNIHSYKDREIDLDKIERLSDTITRTVCENEGIYYSS